MVRRTAAFLLALASGINALDHSMRISPNGIRTPFVTGKEEYDILTWTTHSDRKAVALAYAEKKSPSQDSMGCTGGDVECFARIILTNMLTSEERVVKGEEHPALYLTEFRGPEALAPADGATDASGPTARGASTAQGAPVPAAPAGFLPSDERAAAELRAAQALASSGTLAHTPEEAMKAAHELRLKALAEGRDPNAPTAWVPVARDEAITDEDVAAANAARAASLGLAVDRLQDKGYAFDPAIIDV
jgi:hypothetical protein